MMLLTSSDLLTQPIETCLAERELVNYRDYRSLLSNYTTKCP